MHPIERIQPVHSPPDSRFGTSESRQEFAHRLRDELSRLVGVPVEELAPLVEQFSNVIPARDVEILKAYYGLEENADHRTLDDLAKEFKLSRARIATIRNAAAYFLKREVKERELTKGIPTELPITEYTMEQFFTAEQARKAEILPMFLYRINYALGEYFVEKTGNYDVSKLTMSQVEQVSRRELLRIPNVGKKAIIALDALLAKRGLSLQP